MSSSDQRFDTHMCQVGGGGSGWVNGSSDFVQVIEIQIIE